MHRDHRAALVFLHDALVIAVAWFGAFALRANFDNLGGGLASTLALLPWVLPLQAGVFWFGGLYRGRWRYASLADLRLLVTVVAVSAALVPLVLFFLKPEVAIPRSVLILAPVLQIMAMGGSRALYRLWREHTASKTSRAFGTPIVVVGAGDAGVQLVKELRKHGKWNPIAFLDDDQSKRGARIHGIDVVGGVEDFGKFATDMDVKAAVIAMPSAHHSARARAAAACSLPGIEVLTVPSLDEMLDPHRALAGGAGLRKVEVDDLLGRDPVILDTAGVTQMLTNHVVLVSGAGGSIGSELCRQIAKSAPSLLVLLEASEFLLYQIKEEFDRTYPQLNIIAVAGDVKNTQRVREIMERYRPHAVFHAAAYKHVPLMEEVNAWEAVRNNAFGTYVMASEALRCQVARFVLISTDKAVNPTNVMGATKRLAEQVCQALEGTGVTRFAVVRFGNVLGSNGSVIPKFQAQIAAGGPITVTHPDIIRYFMSIPEAAQLVLQAGSMAVDSAHGEIFVLDMGEPVRIVDLAKQLIRLSGLPEHAIKLEFTGLRPGEKLYEELLAEGESTSRTSHPKILISKARAVSEGHFAQLLDWIGQNQPVEDGAVRSMLKRFVPEYVVYQPGGRAPTNSAKVVNLR